MRDLQRRLGKNVPGISDTSTVEPVYHPGLMQTILHRLKKTCKHCHVGHIKPKKKCLACGELMCTPVKGDKHSIVNLLASEALEWMGVDRARRHRQNVSNSSDDDPPIVYGAWQ